MENREQTNLHETVNSMHEIIRSLINRRNKLGMSQTELAHIIGTKQPAISRLEKGDYNTTLNTFFRVADVLDLQVVVKTRKSVAKNNSGQSIDVSH